MNHWNFINIPSTLFNHDESRDGIARPWFSLSSYLKSKGVCVSFNRSYVSNCINFFVNPKKSHFRFLHHSNSFVIRWEPPIVRPDLWYSLPHNTSNIISWNKDPYTNPIQFYNQPMPVKSLLNSELTKLSDNLRLDSCNRSIAIINSFKTSKFKEASNNGYFLRLKLIHELSLSSLDLKVFGFGWNSLLTGPSFNSHLILSSAISSICTTRSFVRSLHNCYSGILSSKEDLLSHCSFSLVIENSFDDFYVTEKLVDSLYSGVYPIFVGNVFVKSIFPDYLFSFISPDSNCIVEQISSIIENVDLKEWRLSLLDYLSKHIVDKTILGTNHFLSTFDTILHA